MTGRWLAGGLLLAAALVPTAPVPAEALTCPAGQPGYVTTTHTLPGGRTFRLHAAVAPGAAQPLVVALHGLSQSSTVWEPTTCLTPFSEGRFALAYGEGDHASWNAGVEAPSPQACCGWARDHHVDDVAYIAQVIAAAETLTPVDPARVYLVGGSNGGMMALKAGCNLPQVAAVGVVAGSLLVPCPAGVDTVHIHGVADTAVPMGGAGVEGTVFLPLWDEPGRMPRDVVWTLVPTAGGHGWPGWAPAQMWTFFQAVAANPR